MTRKRTTIRQGLLWLFAVLLVTTVFVTSGAPMVTTVNSTPMQAAQEGRFSGGTRRYIKPPLLKNVSTQVTDVFHGVINNAKTPLNGIIEGMKKTVNVVAGIEGTPPSTYDYGGYPTTMLKQMPVVGGGRGEPTQTHWSPPTLDGSKLDVDAQKTGSLMMKIDPNRLDHLFSVGQNVAV